MSNSINTNNFYNAIWGNNTNSASGISSLSNSLTDYASIRNGSYAKLLKNYYAKQVEQEKKEPTKDDETKNDLARVKNVASDLAKSATELYKNSSLFEKKDITKTDENGNKTTTKDYDREAINKAVKEFADNYNTMIKKAADSDDKSVLRVSLNSVKRTNTNAKLLSNVGITIGKDNTLSVDEKKLSEASISDLKSLFSGRGSYAYGISSNASATANYASTQMSDSSLYTSKAVTYQENSAKSIEDYL